MTLPLRVTTIWGDSELYVPDDEFGEKSVSVLLDGEESEIVFIDHPAHEMSVSTDPSSAHFLPPLLWFYTDHSGPAHDMTVSGPTGPRSSPRHLPLPLLWSY